MLEAVMSPFSKISWGWRRWCILCLFAFMPGAPAQVTVTIGQNFTGSDNSQTYITPADGNGAVGLNYYVEFINGSFAVYDKSDGWAW
jgi:hypothetical protein